MKPMNPSASDDLNGGNGNDPRDASEASRSLPHSTHMRVTPESQRVLICSESHLRPGPSDSEEDPIQTPQNQRRSSLKSVSHMSLLN